MSTKTPFSKSLSSLTKTLKSALRLEKRSKLRSPANGRLYLFFGGSNGDVQLEEIRLKDLFAGGIAFQSQQLMTIGSHVCISDGVEAIEASVENRRDDSAGFVYAVLLGELSPLAESWQNRLKPEICLADILQRCKRLSAASSETTRAN